MACASVQLDGAPWGHGDGRCTLSMGKEHVQSQGWMEMDHRTVQASDSLAPDSIPNFPGAILQIVVQGSRNWHWSMEAWWQDGKVMSCGQVRIRLPFPTGSLWTNGQLSLSCPLSEPL